MSKRMRRGVRLGELLLDLEAALRNAALWESQPPDPQALASTEPFCIDTLDFCQWLQFVFLPRMHEILDAGLPLPDKCAIAEMAEVHFAAVATSCDSVMQVLRRIDAVVAEKPGFPVRR